MESQKTLPMLGMKDYKYAIAVSAYDCTGCGSCANVCPGKKGEKALTMMPFAEHTDEQEGFDYCVKLDPKQDVVDKFKENTVKGSQFKQPLLEFSGACGGCGETPYAKLVTQLFGDRMYIANATGCSSIWGNSSPSTPYTVNKKGHGPAWSNSLFEDAAEFGFGMFLAADALRQSLKSKVEAMMAEGKVTAEGQAWLDTYLDGKTNGAARIIWQRSPTGSSAAMAGPMISDSAALTMYWHPARISISVSLILRCTPTQADSPPRLPRPVQSLSLRQPARRPRRRIWLP